MKRPRTRKGMRLQALHESSGLHMRDKPRLRQLQKQRRIAVRLAGDLVLLRNTGSIVCG